MNDIFANAFHALQHGVLGYAVPFLFVLTIVVFFHELGHFLVARWAGVKVLTFSLGFGPELAGFNDRHGTRWKISAIPLGGYVKFFGDESEASTPSAALESMSAEERAVSFHHKKVGPRAAIVAAGPFANFILAIVIFATLFTLYGRPSTTARVDSVQENSAAAKAGFQPGDIVTSINGSRIETFTDMQRIVSMSAGETLSVVVQREGSSIKLTAVPDLREVSDGFGNKQRVGVLGITRATVEGEKVTDKVNFAQGLVLGAKQSWTIVETTFRFIGNLVSGKGGADQIGGPVRIAQISGQAASLGLYYVMNIAAILSVSIGLLNLFPVPLLDGGHLMFYAIEAIRGKPLSERAQEMGFRIGLGLVLMLMVFSTYNDIVHLLSS